MDELKASVTNLGENFLKLWEDALEGGTVRENLDQYGNTVSLGDKEIEWLEQMILTSQRPQELELAAILLSAPHLPLSGACAAKLLLIAQDTNAYSPARIHACVALWTKHINRDKVRPFLQEARDRLMGGKDAEKDAMEAIAEDLLTEEVINPKK